MPKFTLPKPKPKTKEQKKNEVEQLREDAEFLRKTSLPANKAIMDALEIDKPAEVKLRGTVKVLRSAEGDTFEDTEFVLDVDSIEAALVDNTFSDLLDDDE